MPNSSEEQEPEASGTWADSVNWPIQGAGGGLGQLANAGTLQQLINPNNLTGMLGNVQKALKNGRGCHADGSAIWTSCKKCASYAQALQ
nr:hypothetical protein [Bacillus sp. m3-13]